MKAKIREERVCYLMCTPFSYYICYLENLAEEWWWTGDTKTPDWKLQPCTPFQRIKQKNFCVLSSKDSKSGRDIINCQLELSALTLFR